MEKRVFNEEFNNLVIDVCNTAADLCGVFVPDTDEEKQTLCLDMLRGLRDAVKSTLAVCNSFDKYLPIPFED